MHAKARLCMMLYIQNFKHKIIIDIQGIQGVCTSGGLT